ncbi:MAG: ZIP family metal transporter [Anaerolineae bacterium]|nr:ZIP family metal transporter [Anaerolineae bacterium]
MEEVKVGSQVTNRSTFGQAGVAVAALVPLLLLGVVLALFIITGAGLRVKPVAPVEVLNIQPIVLKPGQIVVPVLNSGPEAVTVAQVLVDDAIWTSAANPSNVIPRLGQATFTIPYQWVEGEPLFVKLITSNGLVFEREVVVAALSPAPSLEGFLRFGLVGIYVGVIPVGLGLLWFPFMRRMGRKAMNAILALTVGLLVFLVVDTLLEALEVAGRVPGVFQGVPLVAFGMLLSFLLLIAIGQTRKAGRGQGPSRLSLSYLIALGIGLHNLGEGLAIGAAFALGEAALGAFLVIGFTLHNITEGIGIAAPIAREEPRLRHFVQLAALAGAPAILGTWIGGFVYSDIAAALFFGIGAGAILQVIYEVTRLVVRDSAKENQPAFSWANMGGLTAGILIMYVTAFLVKF